MTPAAEPTVVRRSTPIQQVPLTTGLLVMGVAGLTAAGWLLDLSVLRILLPGMVAMKLNTALAFMLLALALLLAERRGSGFWVARAAALAAGLIGVVTLSEYLFNWDAGIDQAWVADAGTPRESWPGRPAPMTAFNLMLFSAALLAHRTRAGRRGMGVLAATALLLSLVALTGFLYNVDTLRTYSPFSTMSLRETLLFIVIGAGILWLPPESWLRETYTSQGPAAVMTRWLLPFVTVVSVALGWLWLRGRQAGYYDPEFGMAMLTVLSIVGFLVVFFVVGNRLKRLDAERLAASYALLQANDELHMRADELAEANRRLEEISNKDALTDLWNRRAFDSRLVDCIEVIRRYPGELSLLLIDVDRFKDFNDTYGHPAGDNVLHTVSTVFRNSIRTVDFAARIGGEEFAVILPETGIDGAIVQAHRIREAVEAMPWTDRAITVSIGVATCTAAHTTPGDLLRAADKALYQAKREGRNRVCHAQRAEIPGAS